MKITVNWSLCDGNGVCASTAPEVFTIDEDDNMQLLQETIGNELVDKVNQAVCMCPKAALSITED